ncbi:MAG: dihydroneopterin triphosphate diphosphatase [Arenicellales bacterium]|jgi:dATP pyrophosphohydrolase|nr:dihydroneopterin triphosphate diphosphatase [Acidiferrobacteraceae bacterium]MDP6136106.1 dihydroneopterin triphosphate diphosphatase [Arenicellales bacterium]MDP6393181.1 dihydroneopterin triphosphate diphosphatase [Arenicellales bacterium]MDP7221107.1 dihydroneopterin triphosphate diphosphatase [Arenicellales bacterium]HJP11179.1 dihydroneopterin triphosphate diphosphatase [Arenicellales bacterium]|tara:strand:+ start:8271 stop:8735 length:465 start_codon:yes stop_codon:yes gene_type:complete
MSATLFTTAQAYKRPESVLVVVHTPAGQTLLLKRARPVFWQSVTGSLEWPEEPAAEAARRELKEETGIESSSGWRDWQHTYSFPVMPEYRYRYAPAVPDNTEHLFSLEVPETCTAELSEAEHSASCWLSFAEAIEKVWSWSNRDALERVAAVDG